MPIYDRPIAAQFFSSGLAGTLGYTVKSVTGATLVARTTAGITEDGTSGVYSATVGNWDTTWSGTIRWDDGAGNIAVEPFLAHDPATTANAIAAAVLAATVDGETLTQVLRLLRAESLGVTSLSTPGTAIYYRPDGVTEVFRGQYGEGVGRHNIVVAGGGG